MTWERFSVSSTRSRLPRTALTIVESPCCTAHPSPPTASSTCHKREAPTLLGVCNFYRRFIHNSSKVVAPLTRLTSTLKSFQWSEEAEAAFSRLKTLFTSAPIHSHPDPSRQFIVEVDASDTSVGAILW